MLVLNKRELRELLTMREVIEAIEEGFRALHGGEARAPERLMMEMPEASGILLAMPACARSIRASDEEEADALGIKIVSVFENNVERGLDTVQAVYLLIDSKTGVPLSLMEGRFITAIRTAATSAVATKRMAAPAPKRLAIFGAGVQAEFHIEAMIEVENISQVMIASRTEEKARALAEATRSLYGIRCEVVTAEQAAASANLICACTSASQPIFDGRLLTAGVHINAVGAFTPTTRELDSETVRRARIIIDSESAAGREAGDIFIPIREAAIDHAHIKGTLADVVSGAIEGRLSEDEITVFKSCGLAIEDLVTARLAYDKAVSRGAGVRVAL